MHFQLGKLRISLPKFQMNLREDDTLPIFMKTILLEKRSSSCIDKNRFSYYFLRFWPQNLDF